jgi:group I intron endonuclease
MNNQESECGDITKSTSKKSEKKTCCGIYGLRNKINGKWYVGQSVNLPRRINEYNKLKCRKQPKIYSALKKYGIGGFDIITLEHCDIDKLNERETHWILHYDSMKNGYNLTTGGDSNITSNEIKEKRRKSMMGRKLSVEHKIKISNALKGRKKPEEFKKNLKEKTADYNYLKDHPELWTPDFKEKYIASRRKKLKL